MITSEPHPKAHLRVWPLTLKVTQREASLIRERAQVHGVPVGRFLRECAIEGQVMLTHPIAAEQWTSLARVAGNLNAMTRHANQGHVLDGDKVELVLSQLLQVLGEVRSELVA